MRHFATLFDSRYLPQGLALYESLLKHSSEPFKLHILSLDDETVSAIIGLGIGRQGASNTDVWYIERDIPQLKEARASRSWAEYCWTLASNWTAYEMEIWSGIESITYLDADMMFFSDPKVVFDEIGERSIAITPHRLIPSKKHLERNGLFNVGWVTFKNDMVGRACVSKWAAQVRERCSADYGCGDQLYLNEWPELYGDDLCIIENIGVNVGPWSIGNWKVTEGPCLDGVPLVLYHAHEYIHDKRLTNYDLRPEDIELIYKPYVAAVDVAIERVKGIHLPA